MCSRVEVVGEDHSTDGLKFHRHAIDLDLLAWDPFPPSCRESSLFGLIEFDLMSLFKPVMGRHLHQFLQQFLV